MRMTGSGPNLASSSSGGRLAGRPRAGRYMALGAFRAQTCGPQELPIQGVGVVGEGGITGRRCPSDSGTLAFWKATGTWVERGPPSRP